MRGWVCNSLVQLLLSLGGAVTLGSNSRRTHGNILLSNLECQVPVLLSSRNRVVQLYTRALDSLSAAPYDSQGYVGGILTRLHTGESVTYPLK
jgi:hypothetical protein